MVDLERIKADPLRNQEPELKPGQWIILVAERKIGEEKPYNLHKEIIDSTGDSTGTDQLSQIIYNSLLITRERITSLRKEEKFKPDGTRRKSSEKRQIRLEKEAKIQALEETTRILSGREEKLIIVLKDKDGENIVGFEISE